MATAGAGLVDERLPGRFWLVQAAGRAVRGELVLDADGLRLELADRLTSSWRARTASPGVTALAPGDQDQLHTVHGELDDGRRASVVDARGGGLPLLRRFDEGEQTMPAGRAILGDHVAGPEQEYVGVRVRLRNLEEWAQATVLPEPVPLGGGGLLSVQRDTAEHERRPAWVRVTGLPGWTERQVGRCLLTPLASLVSLAADVDCPPVEVELATSGGSPWLPLRASWLAPPADPPRPEHRMLLPLAVLGLAGVADWLGRVERLTPLPPVVAARLAGEPRTLEAGVLVLTTVAEGLHRRVLPQAARRLVYRERLRGLLDHTSAVVPGVPGVRPEEWLDAVVRSRNDFAHQQPSGFLAEDQVDRYLAVRESLRWLLTAALLLETGLPPEDLAERFRYHQRYQQFLRNAVDWLPVAYRRG